MSEGATDSARRLLALVAIVAGLCFVTLAPHFSIAAMDAVLKGIVVKVPMAGNPDLTSAPRVVTVFFPMWGGLCIAAGAALLAVAVFIYRGEGWARPLAVGAASVPAIAGAFMFGPVMFFGRQALPQVLAIMVMGLIPYFLLLLWGPAAPKRRGVEFLLFLFLGVTAAWGFSNGGSALRIVLARGEPSGLYVFLLGIPAVWVGVAEVMAGIPLLVARSMTGSRLTIIGLTTVALGTLVLLVSGLAAIEFSAGIVLAVVSLGLLSARGTTGRPNQA